MQIYDTMVPSQDDIRKWRLSLRHVLIRFCKESDTFPTSLFVPGITLPSDEVPIFGGPSSDIYRCMTPSGLHVALKAFRVFDPDRRHREFSKVTNISLYRNHMTTLDLGTDGPSHYSIPFEARSYC